MDAINRADYYSGGYFLIRASKPDWPQLQTNLLPDKLVSLSECICPRLFVYWGWTPGDRQAALDFGIPESRVDEFTEWCRKPFEADMAYPSMFYSTEAACRFVRRFLPDRDKLYLIGVGLPQELEADYRRAESGEEKTGVTQQIGEHSPLESGGTVLGFEIVSFSYHDFGDSWLCSGLEREMHRLFHIHPNPYGLIDTYKEAKKVYDWIAEDDMQGRRAEPEPYYPWLLVSYPLT